MGSGRHRAPRASASISTSDVLETRGTAGGVSPNEGGSTCRPEMSVTAMPAPRSLAMTSFSESAARVPSSCAPEALSPFQRYVGMGQILRFRARLGCPKRPMITEGRERNSGTELERGGRLTKWGGGRTPLRRSDSQSFGEVASCDSAARAGRQVLLASEGEAFEHVHESFRNTLHPRSKR